MSRRHRSALAYSRWRGDRGPVIGSAWLACTRRRFSPDGIRGGVALGDTGIFSLWRGNCGVGRASGGYLLLDCWRKWRHQTIASLLGARCWCRSKPGGIYGVLASRGGNARLSDIAIFLAYR